MCCACRGQGLAEESTENCGDSILPLEWLALAFGVEDAGETAWRVRGDFLAGVTSKFRPEGLIRLAWQMV